MRRYAVLTSFGRLFAYGEFANDGDASGLELEARRSLPWRPVRPRGYYLVGADGGIFDYGGAAGSSGIDGRAGS